MLTALRTIAACTAAFIVSAAAAQTDYFVNGHCGDDQWTGTSSVCEAPDGPKRTIQAALDAVSAFFDIVHVAPGTYQEAIVLPGVIVSLEGNDPQDTIIDATGLNTSTVSAFSHAAVIRRLTITGGSGQILTDGTRVGGGIFINGVSLQVDDCVIEANTADNGAGIACQANSDLRLTDSVVRNNHASNGAGIACQANSRLRLTDSVIRNNHASDFGGGIWADDNHHLTLDDSILDENTAARGGGLFAWRSGETIIRRCAITNNAALDGAGLYVSGSLEMNDCHILQNTAESGAGGILSRGTSIIINSVIQGNIGGTSNSGVGGIAYLIGPSTLLNSLIISNVGGVVGGVWSIRDSDVLVSGCLIAGNTGDFGGGLTRVETVSNCTIVNNHATTHGGGLDNPLNVINCIIKGNTAAEAGGGIALHNRPVDHERPTIIGSLLVDNTAPDGGGLYMRSVRNAYIINCTLSRNNASRGGSMSLYPSTVQIAGTIDWFNSSPPYFSDDSHVTVRYSNFEHDVEGEGNFSIDPGFIDPANGFYMLASGSPCIDAGDNLAAQDAHPLDLAQLPRFVDDTGTPDIGFGHAPIIDMGAYEFQGISCRADFNNDGHVNTQDFLAFLDAYSNGDTIADFNRDNEINILDFIAFLNAYNHGCS